MGELQKSDESSVWVLNNSNPKGNVTMSMNDGQGQQVVVTVPVTWVPVDLSTQAMKNALLASPNFRRMVSSQMLLLVSEEVAQATMATPAGQKEAQRIYSRVQEMINGVDSNAPQAVVRELAETSGNVSGMALQLGQADDLDEDQILTTLQNNLSALTEADLKYLSEVSRHAKVKEFCAAALLESA